MEVDEKKPFKFSTPKELEELGEKYIDGMIRMQERGIKVDMTEPFAVQLSGIREQLEKMNQQFSFDDRGRLEVFVDGVS